MAPLQLNQDTFLSNRSVKKALFLIVFLAPLLFFLGPHSLTAYDEGYYALQARWILQNKQWLAPQYFSHIVFDRTIGAQWLIAWSYQVFGISAWTARLPSLLCGFISLYLTYQIAKEFIHELAVHRNFPLLASLLLALNPLWLNYTHSATQDIPLLTFELLGLYAILKSQEHSSPGWSFIIGPCIAIAFLIKGFMVAVPLVAMAPYLLLSRLDLFKQKSFWAGLVIGLGAIGLWLGMCIHQFGLAVVGQLWQKLIYLSHSSNAIFNQHSALYYFWNIPLNMMPWALIAIPGYYTLFKTRVSSRSRFFMFYYPLLIFIILTAFKTKTPYYALQIAPLISMAAAFFIVKLEHLSPKISQRFFYAVTGAACFLLLILILFFIGYLTNLIKINDVHSIWPYVMIVAILAIIWSGLLVTSSYNRKVILLLLGPWLALVVLVQFGFLNDRHPELNQLLNQAKVEKVIAHHHIDFVSSGLTTVQSKQKILLAFRCLIVGQDFSSLNALPEKHYAWSTIVPKLGQQNFLLIAQLPAKFGHWALIYKKAKI